MIYSIQYNANKIKKTSPVKVRGTQILLPVKPVERYVFDTTDQFVTYNKKGLVRINQRSTFTYKV